MFARVSKYIAPLVQHGVHRAGQQLGRSREELEAFLRAMSTLQPGGVAMQPAASAKHQAALPPEITGAAQQNPAMLALSRVQASPRDPQAAGRPTVSVQYRC